jgi:uncharacterized membrane protein YsdA (DUF1294 family)
MSRDGQQRSPARNGAHTRRGFGNSIASLLLLGLLALPAFALRSCGSYAGWIAVFAVAMSSVTFGLYAWDKRRAVNDQWRIPEAQLHLLELLGGWPGAWLAQRWLRHKCSKASYQIVFWLIVLGHQFVSFDSLQDWQFSRAALNALQTISGQVSQGGGNQPHNNSSGVMRCCWPSASV